MSSKISSLHPECNILLSSNKTVFSIDKGWESIPYTIAFNTFITLMLFIILAFFRWRVHKTKSIDENKNWLHFIYGDRKINDLKARRLMKINRNHPKAYLPPCLHDYTHQMTDIMLGKPNEDDEQVIPFYKHLPPPEETIRSIDLEKPLPGDELESVRSSLSINSGDAESQINDLCTEYDLKNTVTEDATEVKHLKRLYTDNLLANEDTSHNVDHTFNWVWSYFSISDEQIIKTKGRDTLQYLVFQRYLIYFLTFLTIICLTIILPINLYGDHEPYNQYYAKTTISNLGDGSHGLYLWTHSLATLMTVLVGIFVMYDFSKLITFDTKRLDRKTLLIENIPEDQRRSRILLKWFEANYPDVVIKRITFVYDTRQLDKLQNKLLTAIEAKKYCFQYRLVYGQRCEVRPYCFGKFGGLLCCCGCCPKLDGVLYYAEEKAEIKDNIPKEVIKMLDRPLGIVFVVFESTSMAKEVREKYNQKFSFCHFVYEAIRSHFVEQKDPMQTYKWSVNSAPDPEDIEWTDICLDRSWSIFMNIVMHSILLFIFLFLTAPAISVDILLKPLSDDDSDWTSLLHFAKPYIMMMMTSILPQLVMYVQYQIPYMTKSALSHALMFKTYLFLILMVLILPSVNLYAANLFMDLLVVRNKTENSLTVSCLFPTVNSGFFLKYILSTAFFSNIYLLTRFSELFSYILYLVFISRSIAEYESARQRIIWRFNFGIAYARVLLYFTIVVTYSISSPLMAPAGLFYMVVRHLVDRYNLYYVYSPMPINSQMHSTAIFFVHISLFFLLVQTSTVIYSYESMPGVKITPSIPLFIALTIGLIYIVIKFIRFVFKL